MFKVSFKDTPKSPNKLVTKMGNETTVLLRGTVDLPPFWKYIPEEIYKWIENQEFVEIYEDISKNQLIVYSKGISRCHPNDHYDTILGERMAESRAKCAIYRFFCKLTTKLHHYYKEILIRNGGVVGASKKYDTLYQHEKTHQEELLKKNNHE